jgi:hypothetical protein
MKVSSYARSTALWDTEEGEEHIERRRRGKGGGGTRRSWRLNAWTNTATDATSIVTFGQSERRDAGRRSLGGRGGGERERQNASSSAAY